MRGRQAIVVVDLGYGDSGKGTMVDALARATAAHTVIRFNGGPQALHHVVTDDGRAHGFSQFGAGTFAGAGTYLSKFMLVSPTHLLDEDKRLRALGVTDALRRLTIDIEAPIITPYHRAANWIRELARGSGEHGTCGMGIGEVMQDMKFGRDDLIFAGDLLDPKATALRTRSIQERKREELRDLTAALPPSDRATMALKVLDGGDAMTAFLENCKAVANLGIVAAGHDSLKKLLRQDGAVIFEGAQGVLLDENHGFHPHTTWSTTTCANAARLLSESEYEGEVRRLGILRAYSTRHGAGPMVSYDSDMTAALPEPHNRTDGWQGSFRCGPLDLVASRYALKVAGGVDGLAITCLDRVAHQKAIKVCEAYRYQKQAAIAELKPFFSVQYATGRIVGIRPGLSRDLDRQGKLTEHLAHCRPEHKDVPQKSYLKFLRRELGVPIVATSSGPKASDKTWLGVTALISAGVISARTG